MLQVPQDVCSQVVSQQSKDGSGSPTKEPKPFVCCPICNEFKSNNLYILGRHQKSCEKKMKVTNEDGDLPEEHDQVHVQDEEQEEEDEGEATIEVPVDFEENGSANDQELVLDQEPEIQDDDQEEEMEPPEPITEMMEIAQEEGEETTNEDLEASEVVDANHENNEAEESNQEWKNLVNDILQM